MIRKKRETLFVILSNFITRFFFTKNEKPYSTQLQFDFALMMTQLRSRKIPIHESEETYPRTTDDLAIPQPRVMTSLMA